MEPTEAQNNIINHNGNTVVLASPGSGKTFVMSEKIKKILKDDNLLEYKGVIAISFTRKASANLRDKVISSGLNCKNSFFGTSHKFCLTQIILEFGNHVFGIPNKDLDIITTENLDKKQADCFRWIKTEHLDYDKISEESINVLAELYLNGIILLESVELLALHILQKSLACRNYIRARFTHIFIDEYQDADTYLNDILLSLTDIGLTGVVVGDMNQSIFGFSNKSNIFLNNLTSNKSFTAFRLDQNFRCSTPIINYSSRLLDRNYVPIKTDDNHGVYLVRIEGDEINIAEYIDKYIDRICEKWEVGNRSDTAILVTNNTTQNIIDCHLKINHRAINTTSLDSDINFCSRLYSNLLQFKFNEKMSSFEAFEEFIEFDDLTRNQKNKIISLSKMIREVPSTDIKTLKRLFQEYSSIILPEQPSDRSLTFLEDVLSDEQHIHSYFPIDKNEIVLMTLHKSKGLEFDVVFHLNMNEWEFPKKKFSGNDIIFTQYEQDKFLHYVGLTRAKKACYMIRSSSRTKYNGDIKSASDSEFLSMNDLHTLREDKKFS